MGVGDGLNDGEPEAEAVAAAGAVCGEPLEGLEEVVDGIGGHHRTGVGYG
jgi:hypothetical protein